MIDTLPPDKNNIYFKSRTEYIFHYNVLMQYEMYLYRAGKMIFKNTILHESAICVPTLTTISGRHNLILDSFNSYVNNRKLQEKSTFVYFVTWFLWVAAHA